MQIDSRVQSWKAIEALRAGVPNRDAVEALGSAQCLMNGQGGKIGAEELFRSHLQGIARPSQDVAIPGLLIAGEFGSGKSHLLEYFQHIALQENFVCSKVVVSKETPLCDPAKVFSAAIQSAKLPDRAGSGLNDVCLKLNFDSPEYAQFFHWVNEPASGLDTRFAATLYVFEHGGRLDDPEVSDRIIQFWSGARILNPELKAWLRDLKEAATYKIGKAKEKDIAAQRARFVSRLITAAGYAGWVVLMDEVELIGRYSLRQRARSYAEVARLLGRIEEDVSQGFTSVLSITSDFETEVLVERGDEEKIPAKLGDESGADGLLVSHAERGMRTIRKHKLLLEELTPATIHQIYEKTRVLYGRAYGWEPPTDYKTPDKSRRIRQHIKTWINEWDLTRLYPGYEPDTQVTDLKHDYSETPELEASDEDNPGDSQ